MNEIWKPIHFNKDYEVSNLGNVRNKNKKILSPAVNSKGYLVINIKTKSYNIHRLVAIAFKPISNYKNLVVNHIDSNKLNNNINNLEWCTQKYNIFHSMINGHHYNFSDEDRKKSEENRLNARRKKIFCIETKEIFVSISEAARKYNLKVQNICKCCKGQKGTAGNFHWKYAV